MPRGEWSLSGEIDIMQCFLIRIACVFIFHSLVVLFFFLLLYHMHHEPWGGFFFFLSENFVASFIIELQKRVRIWNGL